MSSRVPPNRRGYQRLPGWMAGGFFVFCLVACATPEAVPGSKVPDKLSIRLYTATTDRRYTYFEVSGKGDLSFAGGKDAISLRSKPVCKLPLEQRQRLWDIITTRKILEIEDSPFDQPERVAHRLTLGIGAYMRSIRCIDDHAEAVQDLHDALFKIQADTRYQSLLIP